MILARTYICSLLRFWDESFFRNSKWRFLTMRVKLLFRYWICCMYFIRAWAWCCVLDVFDWIIIRWITIAYMSGWGCLFRVNSTFGWILCDPWLSCFLLQLIIIWRHISFSLIHRSECFTGESRRWFESIQGLHGFDLIGSWA